MVQSSRHPPVWACVLAFAAGCSGAITDGQTSHAAGGTSGATSGPGAGGSMGVSTPGTGGMPGAPAPDPGPATFACAPGTRSASPARIWRLSPAQYENSVRALSPALTKATFNNPFQGSSSDERFTNYAKSFGLPEPTLDQGLSASRDIAQQLLPRLKTETTCLAAPDVGCLKSAFGALGSKAYRRPLTTDELDRLVTLVSANQATLGVDGALRLGVQALLSSPHFLFRFEIGAGAVSEGGRKKLNGYEVASALSYTLTDGPPDAMLMEAAAKSALATPEQVRAHVVRLLGAPEASKPIQRFLREYLHYDRTLEVFKDPKEAPHHAPPELLDDTERWLADLLTDRKSFVTKLLTDGTGYARTKTAASYNLAATAVPADKQPGKVAYPAGQRAGILTQPSFLTAFSQASENDPIKRGHFIAQSLLCIDLPNEPPMAVPPLPELKDATLREKLQVHKVSEPGCRACHDIMDGLGLGLEAYDHTGRFRSSDVAGKPVDARGEIRGLGNAPVPFDGALEIGAKLAAAPVVEQCVVRHAFRYLFGRDESAADSCALAASLEAGKTAGGDLAEVMVSLLSSESFLYRSAP